MVITQHQVPKKKGSIAQCFGSTCVDWTPSCVVLTPFFFFSSVASHRYLLIIKHAILHSRRSQANDAKIPISCHQKQQQSICIREEIKMHHGLISVSLPILHDDHKHMVPKTAGQEAAIGRKDMNLMKIYATNLNLKSFRLVTGI